MKKLIKPIVFILLWVAFIAITITSCKEQEKQVINKGEKYKAPEYPKLFTYHHDDIESYASAIVMASDGHEYLLFNKEGSTQRLEHYWNCKTCKK